MWIFWTFVVLVVVIGLFVFGSEGPWSDLDY